jgi:copper oxidase (laccase) domain-containing protein
VTAAQQHRDAMLALFTHAADAALSVGATPKAISVNAYDVYNDTGWMVQVHLSSVAEVDAVGDHYGLAADDGDTGNYTRQGVASLGIRATVTAYCGRPDDDGAEVTR